MARGFENQASSSGRSPVAIFAYNRPRHLAAMIATLQSCEGFEESPVKIFVDGPRGNADLAGVGEVRRLVRGLQCPNVTYEFADDNRGLRRSIYAGVSQMVSTYGRVIVLEDDLVLSPIALSYFNDALEHYEHDTRVWSISGYISDVRSLRSYPRTLTLPFAHSWGWATWDRAWRQFDLDAEPESINRRAKSFELAFSMNGFYPYHLMLERSSSGQVDSWYAHWLYAIFRNGGRSVFPPRRVLDNYGISSGTHGGRLNPHERIVRRPSLLQTVPEFSDAGEVDYFALDLLSKSWEARVQRCVFHLGYLKRRIKNMVH